MKHIYRLICKYCHVIAPFIAIVFFAVPFFWLKTGFVDLGGDAGKLYFLDPLASAINIFKNQTPIGASIYSIVSYEFFLSILNKIMVSPTFMVAFDHGVQLALSFYFIYLIANELLVLTNRGRNTVYKNLIAIISGIVYVGFATKVGWVVSMQTQNQVFLNPLIFYLLLRFFLTSKLIYAFIILLITLLYGGNFGFTSMPQIASFFPSALLFLFGLFRFVYHKSFPWKKLLFLGLLFAGVHAFHIIPSVAAVLDKGYLTYRAIFSSELIQNLGVHYFDVNHGELGKISLELFQPSKWNGQNILIFIIPLVAFLGFLKKPSRLLALLGIFFAITFFLVSANITNAGVAIYKQLFYIPGFLMFRSFDEKWYFVYSFFYTLLFAVSFYSICIKKRTIVVLFIGLCVAGSMGYRIYPFLQGKAVNTIHWQSNNVPVVFKMDPDLLDAISYVKSIPDNGNVLTLPLTFPYFQIAYGKEGGAYLGISMVQNLGGKKDYPGFWAFGPYQEYVYTAFREKNIQGLLQLFSFLNVRYIFYNSDSRIMDNFPDFPYIFPGSLISSKDQLPMIKNQEAYGKFLSSLPMKEIYRKGFYSMYEIDDAYIRPVIYIPDAFYDSEAKSLQGSSYRSSFGDGVNDILVQGTLPDISFVKVSETLYDVSINVKERTDPFLVILSKDYHSSWTMVLDGMKNNDGVTHLAINGFANAWIVEPQKIKNDGMMKGTIQLGFQRYFTYGWILSGVTVVFIIIGIVYKMIRKRLWKKIV